MMQHSNRRHAQSDTRRHRLQAAVAAAVMLGLVLVLAAPGLQAQRPAVSGTARRAVDGTSADLLRRVRDPGPGRQRVRRGRDGDARGRRHRAGPVRPRRRIAGSGLPGRRGQGHLRRRPGLGAQGSQHRVVRVARARPLRRGSRPGRRPRRAARRADGAGALGHDALRAGIGPRHRVRGARVPAAPAHRPRHRGEPRVHGGVAGQPAILAEAGRVALRRGRDDQVPHPGRHADEDGGGGAGQRPPRPRAGHRRRPRPLLQGRHRRGDGRLPAGARRAVRAQRLRRVLLAGRGADQHRLPRLHHLQARLQQPGSGPAAGAEHPGGVRPAGDGPQQPRLHPHRRRGDEAGLRGPRHLLRGHRFRRRAGRGPALDQPMRRSARRRSTRPWRRSPSGPATRCRTTRT